MIGLSTSIFVDCIRENLCLFSWIKIFFLFVSSSSILPDGCLSVHFDSYRPQTKRFLICQIRMHYFSEYYQCEGNPFFSVLVFSVLHEVSSICSIPWHYRSNYNKIVCVLVLLWHKNSLIQDSGALIRGIICCIKWRM